MADEKRPRARDVALDAGRRQRQLSGETEDAKRQMLASTLRLAGHSVSQIRSGSVGIGGPTQPEDAVLTDDTVESGGTIEPEDAAPMNEGAPFSDIPKLAAETASREHRIDSPALQPPSRAARQDPEESSGPDATARQDETARIDDSAQQDDTLRFDEAAQTDDALQPDDALQIDDSAQGDDIGEIAQVDAALRQDDSAPQDDTAQQDGAAQSDGTLSVDDALQPDDASQIDDSAESGYSAPPDASDTAGDLLLVDDPVSPFDPDPDLSADDSTLSVEPADQGPTATWLEPHSTPTVSGLLVPSASSADSMSAANSLTGDLPPDPDSSIVLDGDSVTFHTPPAPGTKLFFPSPGADSLSDASADGSGGNAEGGGDGDGGRTTANGAAGGTPASNGDSQSTAGKRSIDVTPIRSDEIQAEVVQRVAAMIDVKVAQRIDELRHETFVSRAAFSALFPR